MLDVTADYETRREFTQGETQFPGRTDRQTGQDRTGQDRTGQDRTGQDRTEQNRTEQNRTNSQPATEREREGEREREKKKNTGRRWSLHVYVCNLGGISCHVDCPVPGESPAPRARRRSVAGQGESRYGGSSVWRSVSLVRQVG